MNFRRALLVAVAMLAVSSAAMAADPGYFMVNTLTIDPTAYLDMPGWGVVTGGTPYATVNGYITDPFGATGRIRSSVVANDPLTLHSIGSMSGQDYNDLVGAPSFQLRNPVLPNDSLLRVTYWGDSNLDGTTNFDDYGYINFAYAAGGLSGWVWGDYDRNGTIDFDDYGYINYAYASISAAGAAGAGAQAVPEPSVVVLLLSAVVGFVAFLRKR
jgi:hypothetical protein